MKFLQGYCKDKDVLAKWEMVCIDPQAHKLRVCSHSKLRCSSEAAKAQKFMAAFCALHLHYSTQPWNLHVVLPLQHEWHHTENISEGKSYPYPLPTATQCPLTHSHSGDAHSELNTGVIKLTAETGANQPLSLGIKSGWL